MEIENEQQKKEAKFQKMTTDPVKKLICSLAVPTVISMLITSFYNIVDTFFVGQIDTNATAGVGLVFPIMTIIQAFGFFFGQGSGNYISRALGAKNEKGAEKMAATGCLLALFFGGLILLTGTILRSPILFILGAREDLVARETIDYAKDYLQIILMGAPFLCASCVLNNQMRFQGNAVFSMIGLVSGAILNCILDPLFILVWDLKVFGAALATIIGQFTSFVILYIGTLRSDSLKIRIKNFTPTIRTFLEICRGGAPSLFRQGLASIAMLCLNVAAGAAVAKEEADAAVAAFTVVNKIMALGFSALLGFGQGFQPFCGFNYGAKLYKRVKEGYVFCLKVGLVCLFVISAIGFILAPQIIPLFRDDPKVLYYGIYAMRAQCVTFTLMGVVSITNMLYQNIGKVIPATLLAMARQGLMFIPVVLLLPKLFNPAILGVYLAQPLADFFSFCLAVPLAILEYKELSKKAKEQSTIIPV